MKTQAQHQKSRTRKDVLMSRLISLFGVGVLATITVLIWYLFSRTLPLFIDPWLALKHSINIEQGSAYVKATENNVPDWFEKEPVVWLSALPQARTVFVGYEDHTLTRWIKVNKEGEFHFVPTYSLQLKDNEYPLQLESHANTNAVFLLTSLNRIIMFNRVTGEQLHAETLNPHPLGIEVVNNEIKVAYEDKIDVWAMKNLAGVTTLNSLFNKQYYEGYANPEYIYQTAPGSDFIEAKYSLIALFVGSIKVAASAIGIAIPIALGAAVFSGYFAPYQWRNRIKGSIEMLEAVPSVVIGFIAAVLLTPFIDAILLAIAFFIVTLPLIAFLFAYIHQYLSRAYKPLVEMGRYLVIACIIVIAWGILCFYFARSLAPIELFYGTSKTTLIVAIALGLAISPTIYTIADDAIHSVPHALKNASFALGATQLQTLSRVVLRVAKPGLVAAVMLGFGRAIGETMIVLMVTGNTPIPSWSLFESVRTLTANLAIEFTEAENGNELSTILFFTATSLFVFTFVCNSFAELLRYHMRKAVENE